jgi:hypothetical protein
VKRVFASLLTASLVATAVASDDAASKTSAAPPKPPRVLVGPNILVSRDGDVPHVELMIAASPKTSRHLLGGAITATRPEGGMACRAYSSIDGGSTWKSTEFAEQIQWGGGDPQVAFTLNGTALFSALAFAKTETGKMCASMHVWRSEDGGKTWDPPTEIACSPSWDHPQIAVDHTPGRFAGRIYIGVLYDYPTYRVGIFRSDDDGRTWVGPVEAANGGGKIGINVINVMVLRDGTLVVPYIDFEFLPDKRTSKGKIKNGTWIVTSSDGGITFSEPRKVQTLETNQDDPDYRTTAGMTAWAADSGQSSKFRDRLYLAWTDFRHGRPRILFSSSKDRGKTWSDARQLDSKIPAGARQWQPVVATNKDGVVAVTWYDTRDSKDGREYNEYFAASIDGGETFLPSAKVSSAPSDPKGSGNAVMTPMIYEHQKKLNLSFLSAASRWGSGGDYMGLTADKEGNFHPFWADSRSGTFQIYTARVKVEVPQKDVPPPPGIPAPPVPPKAATSERAETDLVGRVEVIFDPTRYDTARKELTIPIRLKNVSEDPIYPPLKLEITGIGFPEYESEDDKKENAENAPEAVNSINGKSGIGAVFDLNEGLAGLDALEPGAQTGPLVLRFKLKDPDKTPSIQIKATGQVERL